MMGSGHGMPHHVALKGLIPNMYSFIGGGEGCMRRGEILHHVVIYATYHRGHIEGALYQMGVESGTTDLPVFLREGGLLIGGSWT